MNYQEMNQESLMRRIATAERRVKQCRPGMPQHANWTHRLNQLQQETRESEEGP